MNSATMVPPPSRSLALPACFALVDGALTVTGEPSYEQWQQCGPVLARMSGAVQWWIGDWLNYGEHAYGEKYAQCVSETQAATWTNYAWVARSVSISTRVDLSWAHHRLVAKFEPQEQAVWLKSAVEGEWTVSDLRDAIRSHSPPDEWTLDEALKIADAKLEWLRDRWPEHELEALDAKLRAFAEGLAVDV